MCGIVGAVAQRQVQPILLAGLQHLEYRGYDSAGMAILDDNAQLQRARVQGKVQALADSLSKNPLIGTCGISHTRWATHGEPSERNAHPHVSNNEIAVVHNGIIENFAELREKLIKLGYHFNSETDTETIVHLIHHHLQNEKDPIKALKKTVAELKGAYALGIMLSQHPQQLWGVRAGAPLVLGLGFGENFLASDHLALLPVTQRFIYLEDGDIVHTTDQHISIYDSNGQTVQRAEKKLNTAEDLIDKGHYRHFMAKEIFEQPTAVAATLSGRLHKDHVLTAMFGPNAEKIVSQAKTIHMVACGTSYHAALIARYWIERYAQISCHVEIASEYRYRAPVVPENTLFVGISQSGETADTLAALRLAKELPYIGRLTICNMPESAMVREAELVLLTHAGREIGVASTKAFTTQLVALMLLMLALVQGKKLNSDQCALLINQLETLPQQIEEVLALDSKIQKLAHQFGDKQHALFLGRGTLYPIALEGALKLKEISYVHAEGYPAGELKHGPLALVDKHMPVVAMVTYDELTEKVISNLQEVAARGGQLIVFADKRVELSSLSHSTIISLPIIDGITSPVIFTVPLQLLAYHVAVLKGTDVDQPRNLAKSVTVE